MSNRAWVTLATNDSYGLGALVLAHSLRRAASSYPAVVLITPSVTEPMRERLRAVFAEVILVDVLDSKDATHLALLQRPELGITFTKIHCWSLTQYEKCVFLDADTLIVQNCDELFEREELSAAPDVGWPDCFNSGVFVFAPSADTFSKLITFASERGSFDGGDQGLLNSYFSDWAHGDINKHLPFLYNVTSAAFYSYIPALKHYGQNLKIIHFIGAAKPWLQHFNWQSRSVEAPEHLRGFLQLWWDLFVAQVHLHLDTQMDFTVHDRNYLAIPFIKSSKSIHTHNSVVSDRNNMCSKQQDSYVEAEVEEVPLAIDLEETTEYNEPVHNYGFYEPILDPSSEFPWHHPDNQTKDSEFNEPDIDMNQFHDPWNIYRGNIPPSTDTSRTEPANSQRQYAWDYVQPQKQHLTSENSNFERSHNKYELIQSHSQDQSNIWQYKSEHSSQSHNKHHFTPSEISEHDESQHNLSLQDIQYHDNPIHETVYQQDNFQSHSNQQCSRELHQQNYYDSYQDNHGHNNYQNFEHHQNDNNPDYSSSQHFEHVHHDYQNNFSQHHFDNRHYDYQNNFSQHHFENHQHEQNQNNNHQHLSEYQHHDTQHSQDHFHFDQRQQNVNYHQDTQNTQSQFYSHSDNFTENNKCISNDEKFNHNYRKNVESTYSIHKKKQTQLVYSVMMDHERISNVRKSHAHLNGCETEYHSPNTFEEIPRHPYDGFYLRHRITIDSRGRKICIHEIPFSPPSPTPSLESSTDYEDAVETLEDEEVNYDRLNGHGSQTGVAGNLARVVPGAPQQQDAVDELTRRQGWEAGNIDYMGADSFDNIWAKISQTLSQPPSSPPRQSSPPKEQPIAVPVEEAKEVKEVSAVPLESKPEESIKGITPSEVPSETSVAVEAPVVAPEVVAAIEAPISSEISENVAPAQAVETVASTETSESVPPTEVPACVFTPEASDCVSHPEVPEPVVQVEATECVSPSKVSETVAPIEATCVSPPQASENVPSAETKESTASSETTASVVTGEATEIVSLPEATATVTASVAPPEATESVSPPEEAVSVVSTEATESVSPPEAAISVASTEATESVSPPEAVVSVASTEPTESVSQPEAAVNVASTKATESVSSPEAGGSVVPTEATESVSPPEATVNVLSTKATESVSPPEATVNVPSTEATESVSPPVATGSVAPTETTESVSPSEATVSVAPTEGSATVTPPDAAKNVAPTEAIESISLPEATAFEPIETEETVPSSESPAAAASIEEPVVDVPVPVIEAAESAGKQEDSIPVPVETAAVPAIIPAETKDIPVSADEAVKIDNVCASPAPVQTTVPAVENESEPSLNKSVADSESFTDKKETTSEQALDKKQAVSDSPPLANTPSKEEIPIPPAAKTEERRKPAGKLSLPPACCDTLPTPDSEVEDAASLAHAIIAGELRTPTVTSPSPPVIPPLAQTQPTQPRSLSVDQPDVPTPPIESSQISLTQIAVKSKPSIASQIETSVSKTESTPTAEASEAPKPKSDAPKKKIIKKVVKKVEKEAAPSGDAPVPVPPPRKKEKKPKEK